MDHIDNIDNIENEPVIGEIIEYEETNELTLADKLATAAILTATFAAGVAARHFYGKAKTFVMNRKAIHSTDEPEDIEVEII